jgi:hypothetical protein
LQLCAFFLIGRLKAQMIHHSHSSPEELRHEVVDFLSELSKSMIARMFHCWTSRLDAFMEFEGESVESMPDN